MSNQRQHETLLGFVFEHSFLRGKFKLASGKESEFYLNAKKTTLDPEGSRLVAETFLEEAKNCEVDSIGGLEIGAVPIVSSVVSLSAHRGYPVRGFIVRKKRKKHGTQELVEGRIEKNDRVIVIDDVITTGTSAYQAVEEVLKVGCQVIKVISLIDRNEGGRELFRERGFEYQPIITIEEIFQYEKAAYAKPGKVVGLTSSEKSDTAMGVL